MSTVYRKTEKGQAEIETRAFRLVPRLRQALILVDGRRSDADLSAFIAGDAAATLAGLLADGFIEPLVTLADPTPAPRASTPSSAEAAAAPRKTVSVESTRRDAVRFLNDQLGPAAESIALKLERAKTVPEMQPLLVAASQVLRSARGAEVADAFIARFVTANAAA
jgi:hypothetical protein